MEARMYSVLERVFSTWQQHSCLGLVKIWRVGERIEILINCSTKSDKPNPCLLDPNTKANFVMSLKWWLVLGNGLRWLKAVYFYLMKPSCIVVKRIFHSGKKNLSHIWDTRVFWSWFKGHCKNLIPSADQRFGHKTSMFHIRIWINL